ncbi:MAG: TonB family protein [Candidatus Eisenbacteria bacterium]
MTDALGRTLLSHPGSWGRREESAPRVWAITISIVLHAALLLGAGGWLKLQPRPVEMPFVVSLLPPGADAPGETVSFPPRRPVPPAEAGAPSEGAVTGSSKAPAVQVLESIPEIADRAAVIEVPQSEANAGGPQAASRERRDVVGEATAQLLEQTNMEETLPIGPLAPAAPVTQPSSRGSRTGAAAGIAGPLGGRGLLYDERPQYPSSGSREGIETEVRFRFWVSPSGNVLRVRTLRKSGHPEFESLAREALSRWRFEPLPPGQERQEWGEVRMIWGLPQGAADPDGSR